MADPVTRAEFVEAYRQLAIKQDDLRAEEARRLRSEVRAFFRCMGECESCGDDITPTTPHAYINNTLYCLAIQCWVEVVRIHATLCPECWALLPRHNDDCITVERQAEWDEGGTRETSDAAAGAS